MEENVALDSSKKKKFLKSIKGIKKLIKKNEGKPLPKKEEKVEKAEPQKRFSMKLKDGKIKKKKRRQRGLVYLSHIPHGFYEHQMVQYFKQFGVVTNARVIRSKRTGTSKGYAFVEFKEPAVGQIVAETMNNYLMGKRLIKAAYIPPEKQRVAYRKHWNSVHNPGSDCRKKMKKAINAVKDEKTELKKARKLLANLTKNKQKLTEIGINYDFFVPVDIPEALLSDVVKQENNGEDIKSETDKPTKKIKEEGDSKKNINKEKTQNAKQAKTNAKTKDTKKKTVQLSKSDGKSKSIDKEASKQNNKNEKAPVKVNKKEQKQKEEQLKAAGVKKPLEEFVKIGEESDDSDSYDFDSDEYEKVLEAEDSGSDVGSDESDDDGDDETEGGEESDEEEEEIPTPPKKLKQKPVPKQVQAPQTRKQAQKPQAQKQKKPVEVKRKVPQKAASPKKQKFEKINQKPLKKQFKKK